MRTLIGPRSAHDRRTLEERAVALRAWPTSSEAALWEAVRARRLGVTFRRQVLIGGTSWTLPRRRVVSSWKWTGVSTPARGGGRTRGGMRRS
jgi:hypothetical protein